MTDNNLHEYLQSAYKPGHSTETVLMKVQNGILTSIGQHGIVILILLDLVQHLIPLTMICCFLEWKALSQGPNLKWVRSYLSDCTLRVQIDDSFSASQLILLSVPQESVLGPLLFLVYLLSLGILLQRHGLKLHAYADDTQLYIPINQHAINIGVAKLENY